MLSISTPAPWLPPLDGAVTISVISVFVVHQTSTLFLIVHGCLHYGFHTPNQGYLLLLRMAERVSYRQIIVSKSMLCM